MKQTAPDGPSPPAPLKPVHFHILRVLLDGHLHGYRIAKDIEDRTAGRIRLEPGNLYRFVRTLVDEGLVERIDPGAEPTGRRRAYGITEAGRRALAADVARMRALVSDAELALSSTKPRG